MKQLINEIKLFIRNFHIVLTLSLLHIDFYRFQIDFIRFQMISKDFKSIPTRLLKIHYTCF